MTHQPRYNSNREYESPLHEFRVSKGLFVRELAEYSGVSQGTLSALANGMLSPLTEKGEVRISAKRLSSFFNVGLSDLFPRYFCRLDLDVTFTDDQIASLMHSSYEIESTEEYIERKDFFEKVLEEIYIASGSRRNFKMACKHLLFEQSLLEIGEEYQLSCARVRQIIVKVLHRVRWSLRKYISVEDGN